jgi:hypothetical protein
MRPTAVLVVLLLAAALYGAGDVATASDRLDGKKLSFSANGIAGGVRATSALLESCHSIGEGTAADLTKAQSGDHIRLVFAKPVAVEVLDRKLKMSDLVFTQPLNTGVFWLRAGNVIVRCTKYEPDKEKDFVQWRNEARVAE